MLHKEFEDISNNNIIIQPKIDIICLKMLQVIGFNPEPVTFNVRRKLFGCCNDSSGPSVSDSLAEQATEYAAQSSKIWNFDFVAESPLPAGRYAWEKVRETDVPALYAAAGCDDQSRCPSADQLLNSIDSRDLHQKSDSEQDVMIKQTNQNLGVNLLSQQMDCVTCGQVSSIRDHEESVRCPKRRFVQTNMKAYTKVQKNSRITKRTGTNRKMLKFSPESLRVVSNLLTNHEESSNS